MNGERIIAFATHAAKRGLSASTVDFPSAADAFANDGGEREGAPPSHRRPAVLSSQPEGARASVPSRLAPRWAEGSKQERSDRAKRSTKASRCQWHARPRPRRPRPRPRRRQRRRRLQQRRHPCSIGSVPTTSTTISSSNNSSSIRTDASHRHLHEAGGGRREQNSRRCHQTRTKSVAARPVVVARESGCLALLAGALSLALLLAAVATDVWVRTRETVAAGGAAYARVRFDVGLWQVCPVAIEGRHRLRGALEAILDGEVWSSFSDSTLMVVPILFAVIPATKLCQGH